ncbi:MAG TPA: radical SAM protein [Thermoanaerobaculia bacterium]|jgi:MoaA/NifB/PqqE/SkfB family radical SAM enzyme|nr:radical SAM protein [Thermoanaerobaculia bacterium]
MDQKIRQLLRKRKEKLASRNNALSSYLPRMTQVFERIKGSQLRKIPPPFCVQFQVSQACSTHCEMCTHYRETLTRTQMPTKRVVELIEEMGSLGVRALVFSGGEPLMRRDLAILLRAAARAKCRVGLLTSATTEISLKSDDYDAIAEAVDWIAVSIDGVGDTDAVIRWADRQERPRRADQIRDFCSEVVKRSNALVEARTRSAPIQLTATVTLQQANINMDFQETCTEIQKLGIGQVTFKLATGAKDTLEDKPKFLLTAGDLDSLVNRLHDESVTEDKRNNLDYLRRAFTSGLYDIASVADGAPLHRYYQSKRTRCFTVFTFALIEADGQVYPCCHLYRDNHGADPRSRNLRKENILGDVSSKSFATVWNNKKYGELRKALSKIDPASSKFLPCGECTRHCQHNMSLTEAFDLYQSNPEAYEEVVGDLPSQNDKPVWF